MIRKIKLFLKAILLLFVGFLILGVAAFYLLPLPISWQANFVSTYADYFFQDEEEWLKEHNVGEIALVKAVEFKLRHDITNHMYDRLQLETHSQEEAIDIAANEVRNIYITQMQEEIPVVSNSATVSFIRGYGFCDQINAALALLLHNKLDQVQLYGIINPGNQAKHTLIKSKSSLGTVWIDAFTCVNAFGFSNELTATGKELIPTYAMKSALLFEKEAYQEGFFFNEFSLSYSAKKAFSRIENLLTHKFYDAGQVMVMEKPDSLLSIDPMRQKKLMEAYEEESLPAKKAYLTARIYHLYGQKEKALDYYALASKNSGKGVIRMLANVFSMRLKGAQTLCQM